MTLDEFVKSYNGQAIDYDNSYDVQCVDLIKLYADKVLGLKFGAFGNAHAYYDNFDNIKTLKDNFIKIANTPQFIPQKGDIAVWNTNIGNGCGHIAIATGKGTTSKFNSYDMNWNGKAMKKIEHTYQNFSGVLRPKAQEKVLGKYIKYEVHIQNIGWQEQKEDGQIAGTTGQELRIEAIKIHASESIKYRVHIQDIGWQEWLPNDCMAGIVGQSKRLEAIEIVTEGSQLKAQAHIQNVGWQKEVIGNVIKIGTEGKSLRLEALKLEFV